MKMEHYLAHTDYPIWEVIQNGNGPVSITTDTSGQIKVLPPRTAEEIVARERERKARTTLLMALPEDHLAKFHKMTDAKEMWDAIKSRFGGNDESKKMQKYILKQQFEGFSVSNTEGLHKGYDRFQSLLSQLEIHGAGVSTEDANQKFLRSLPSACCPQLDHEDLEQINEYDLEEIDLKWQVAMISMRMKKFYKKTGRKLQFDAKEPVGFDKTKVECYNCHKTGHFAKECRIKGNQDNRRRDAWNSGTKDRSRTGQKEDSKALVTINGECVDWKNHSEDEDYALMACNSSDSDTEVISCSTKCKESYANLKKLYDVQREQLSDASIEIKAYSQGLKKVEAQLVAHQQGQLWYEQKIKFMKIDLDDKTDVLTYHKKLLAEAQKEKEDLKAKVEKWHNSSKNLSKLLNTQMSANDKFGLGYGDHRYDGILSYENEVLQSVFMNKESEIENQPLYDRFVTTEGMHAVPPPMTGNYMPSGPEIEVDYSQFTYGPKQTQPSESESQSSEFDTCESNISTEPSELVSEPVVNESNVECQPKVWSDAPIIEEYESDSEDEYVSIPTKQQETPSFANQQVKTPRENVKSQFTHSQKPKVDKKDLGYGFTDYPHRDLKNKGIVDSGFITEFLVISAGKGDSKFEDESAQDCFVLPIWPSYSLTITPDLKTDEKRDDPREEKQVFMDELERLKRQEKEANEEAEALKKKFEQETEHLVIQDRAARTSNTESLGLSRFALWKKLIGTKWSLRNKKIEFTNLETVVNVSPIPTSRIYSSHPTALILGDPTLAVQTRSKVDAMQEELLQFKIQKVWVLVDLPHGKKAISIKQEEGIDYDEDKYVAKILKKFDFANVKTASTPIETQKPLVNDEEASDVDVHLYWSMIGSLMYLTASRPDIMFAVCACSRFQVTSKSSHLSIVKRIFRYLKGKPKLGLWYPKVSTFDLESYSDSDYVGANLDRKSTTGGCQFLGRRLISWQCKKQTIVATSTTEAEYVAAASCCGQVLWIQNQMLDYGFNFMNTKIYIDNESTICIVKNPVYHSKTKHIAIRHHFIRDAYEKKLIQVLKIHTDDNVADLLTKAFDVSRGLIEFRESLRRVTDGTEALLIPTLFILWLDKVSTDSAKLVPLGKVCTAIETLKKNTAKGTKCKLKRFP
ncbi:ribonuclease H-like domain-containing protein [Tanacetum coccineum]